MTEGNKAIALGAFANLFLSLLKFAGDIFGNSITLVADAFQSLSDLITDGVIYFSYGELEAIHQIDRARICLDLDYEFGKPN